DQRLEILGPAIRAVGRVPEHAVIAPAASAGEIGERHQFQCRNSRVGEMIEPVDHGAIAAAFRKGADMGLDEDRLSPGPPAPILRAPGEGVLVDYLARAHHIFRLEGGSGIWHVDLVIDAEFVARAWACLHDIEGVPASVAAAHGERLLLQHEIDAFRRRCPEPKRRAILVQCRAKSPFAHAAPAKASTDRGGAFVSAPDAKSALSCLTSVVFSTCCQLLYSGIFGSLNAISSGAAFSTIKIGACPCSIGPST